MTRAALVRLVAFLLVIAGQLRDGVRHGPQAAR